MVFSSTRKGCMYTRLIQLILVHWPINSWPITLATEFIYQTSCNKSTQNDSMAPRVARYTQRIQDTSLREWLNYGIAIHTAGLCISSTWDEPLAQQDRSLVETLFENGLIQVVCTTSTLALGVNLPVYLVIIKGTVQWKGGGRGYEEIDNAMLQQMVDEKKD